jgi:hypothetical protein
MQKRWEENPVTSNPAMRKPTIPLPCSDPNADLQSNSLLLHKKTAPAVLPVR